MPLLGTRAGQACSSACLRLEETHLTQVLGGALLVLLTWRWPASPWIAVTCCSWAGRWPPGPDSGSRLGPAGEGPGWGMGRRTGFGAVLLLESPFPHPLRGLRGGSWVCGTGPNLVGDGAGVLAGAGPGCGCLESPAWLGWWGGMGRLMDWGDLCWGRREVHSPCLKAAPQTPGSRRASPVPPSSPTWGTDGEVKPPGWGARVRRKWGDPLCTLSSGWPGGLEAINWFHSSCNEMEMKLPDRGALSWGRMVASSWAWMGSAPRPCPLLRGPPKPPRQEHPGHAAEGGRGPPCPESRPGAASE